MVGKPTKPMVGTNDWFNDTWYTGAGKGNMPPIGKSIFFNGGGGFEYYATWNGEEWKVDGCYMND